MELLELLKVKLMMVWFFGVIDLVLFILIVIGDICEGREDF